MKTLSFFPSGKLGHWEIPLQPGPLHTHKVPCLISCRVKKERKGKKRMKGVKEGERGRDRVMGSGGDLQRAAGSESTKRVS